MLTDTKSLCEACLWSFMMYRRDNGSSSNLYTHAEYTTCPNGTQIHHNMTKATLNSIMHLLHTGGKKVTPFKKAKQNKNILNDISTDIFETPLTWNRYLDSSCITIIIIFCVSTRVKRQKTRMPSWGVKHQAILSLSGASIRATTQSAQRAWERPACTTRTNSQGSLRSPQETNTTTTNTRNRSQWHSK